MRLRLMGCSWATTQRCNDAHLNVMLHCQCCIPSSSRNSVTRAHRPLHEPICEEKALS